jgi:general secretion pathway protein F
VAVFDYKAIDARGEVLRGRMEAATRAEVAARLQEQGHLPVEARPAGPDGPGLGGWPSLRRRPLSGDALPRFTQQLATLLGAGQPLDRALSILLEVPEDEPGRRMIADIQDAVRGGASLSASMEGQHGVFSRLYLNMVRAGEAGGNLHESLQRLADYLERSQALKARVLNALIYPAILLAVVGMALGFLLGYVVPQFASMYESLDVPLPWFTRAVLWLGDGMRIGWPLLIVVPAALAWGLVRGGRHSETRVRLDAWLLRRPLVGPLLLRLETARLTRTAGTLLKNGVPLLAALGIVRNVLDNQALAIDVDAAADRVRNGQGLSAALGVDGRFPRLALQMIQVGEESGALDAMLLKAADIFEQEAGRSMDRLLAALVPAVTLVLASLVGLVIVAVLVPLYDLTGALG